MLFCVFTCVDFLHSFEFFFVFFCSFDETFSMKIFFRILAFFFSLLMNMFFILFRGEMDSLLLAKMTL